MPAFLPGLRLSRLFYEEAVKPLLESSFPGLRYAAALLGSGSDVLGYDTPLSTDHHWGPRLLLFLGDEDHRRYATALDEALRARLPYTFRGYPTNFGRPDEIGVRLLEETSSGPVNHMVSIATVASFFANALGVDPYRTPSAADWLKMSEQKLLEVTGGEVFHDGLAALHEVRRRFAYPPHDVWLYLLARQWHAIAEEEAFVGRCGDVGDDLGSRLIAGRLVQQLMKLCFLMEKQYAPYSKWFGTAFGRLSCAGELHPVLAGVLRADTWRERERALSEAYGIVARRHNALGVTEPLDESVSRYYARPYLVIHADRFAAALMQAITSPEVRAIGEGERWWQRLAGSTERRRP